MLALAVLGWAVLGWPRLDWVGLAWAGLAFVWYRHAGRGRLFMCVHPSEKSYLVLLELKLIVYIRASSAGNAIAPPSFSAVVVVVPVHWPSSSFVVVVVESVGLVFNIHI